MQISAGNVDNKRKASLKFETNNPKIRADFLEENRERFFVVVIGSPGTGNCGDLYFAIVKIDERLDVKISDPNKPNCQGEFYDAKVESVNLNKQAGFYRRLSVGKLKFNLQSFEWENN